MPARPRWLALLDRLSVSACALVWIGAILDLAPHYRGGPALMAIGVGAGAGYLAADFVSGTVHWMADRYFDPRTPILGPALIAPFREHHADQLAMTRHDFFEVSGNNGLVTIPLALGVILLPAPSGFWTQALAASVVSLGLSVIATNQFHCWAHVERPPRFARRLQAARLILSPEAHAVHHAPSHDRAYCVTSGWLNPVLDRAGFFPRLENRIAALRRSAPTAGERSR